MLGNDKAEALTEPLMEAVGSAITEPDHRTRSSTSSSLFALRILPQSESVRSEFRECVALLVWFAANIGTLVLVEIMLETYSRRANRTPALLLALVFALTAVNYVAFRAFYRPTILRNVTLCNRNRDGSATGSDMIPLSVLFHYLASEMVGGIRSCIGLLGWLVVPPLILLGVPTYLVLYGFGHSPTTFEKMNEGGKFFALGCVTLLLVLVWKVCGRGVTALSQSIEQMEANDFECGDGFYPTGNNVNDGTKEFTELTKLSQIAGVV